MKSLSRHDEFVDEWRPTAETHQLDEHEELTAYATRRGLITVLHRRLRRTHQTHPRYLGGKLNGVQIAELVPLTSQLHDILNERRTLMTGLKELAQHATALETHTRAREHITESAARDEYAQPVFHPEYPAWRREADQLIATTRRYFASDQPAIAGTFFSSGRGCGMRKDAHTGGVSRHHRSWLDSVEGAVRTRRTALSRSAGQLSSAAAQARPGPRRCRQGQAVDTFMIVSRASCARAA